MGVKGSPPLINPTNRDDSSGVLNSRISFGCKDGSDVG